MQLMRLEQQNKKRLLEARQKQEQDGFPASAIQEMQKGHDKFMRESQQDLRKETKTPLGNDNLFVSFKSFIDSSLGSLADSITQLPNNIAELRARMQEGRERREQDELLNSWRWTGQAESSGKY